MRLSPGKSLIETCKTAEVGFGIGTNNLVPGRLGEDECWRRRWWIRAAAPVAMEIRMPVIMSIGK